MAESPAELPWLLVSSIFSDHPPASSTIAERISVSLAAALLSHLVATLTLPKLHPFLLLLHPCPHTVLPACPLSLPALTATPHICSCQLSAPASAPKCSLRNLSPLTLLLGQPRSSAQLSAAPNDLCLGPVFAVCDPEGKAPGTGGSRSAAWRRARGGEQPVAQRGGLGRRHLPLWICLRALACRLTTRTNLWVCVCACLSLSLPPA